MNPPLRNFSKKTSIFEPTVVPYSDKLAGIIIGPKNIVLIFKKIQGFFVKTVKSFFGKRYLRLFSGWFGLVLMTSEWKPSQWDIGVASETLAGITADPHFLQLFAPNAPR